MNLKQLVDIIFKKSSKWMMNEGNKIYKNGLVSNVKSKRINNIYNIYGKVADEKKALEYDTHIRINISTGNLQETICTCGTFIENAAENKTFLCPHLVGTAYMFNDLASKKLQSKNKQNEEKSKDEVGDKILKELRNSRDIKEKLNIEVKLNYVSSPSLGYHEAEFKIGKKSMYVINSLEDFIEARAHGDTFFISNDFIYDSHINYFSDEDEEVIRFIEEYILINKEISEGRINSSFQLFNGRRLRILPNALRRFLQTINNKTIKFKYEYIDYNTKILSKDLPISFTLKENEEGFVLTTKKQFPIPLTSNGEVYLYYRELYLPSKTQSEIYKPFYEHLKTYGKIIFSKNTEVFQELITKLNSISKDITFDEGVKNFASSLITPKFYLHKESEEISCEVKLCYGEKVIDIINDSKKKSSTTFRKINLQLSTGEGIYLSLEPLTDDLILRDLKKEEKIEMQLQRLKFTKGEDEFLFVGDDNELYNLLTKGLKALKNIGEVILGETFKSLKIYDSSFIQSSISEAEDGFFNFSYNIGDVPENEFKNLFTAFKDNRSFYKTKDNSFIDLEDDGIRSFFSLLENLNWNESIGGNSIKINKNMGYYLENDIEKRGLSFIEGQDLLKDISNRIIDTHNADYEVPMGLTATLREYQVTGYKWLKTLSNMEFGGILADEMGLGKTIQTISFLLSEKGSKSIIVMPTSLIYNWKDEFQRFAQDLKIGIIHGNREERVAILDNIDDYNVLLTTYGTLRNDFELYDEMAFDYCIIDEGQNIKNPLAQSTDTVKKINAKVKFALTGTPIENNLMELWSIFDFIMPGYLYSKERFGQKFINTAGENIEELRTLIRPFILRREKKDVLKELPDKIEKKFLVAMTPVQGQIYKAYMKEVKEKLKSNKEDRITIFSYLTRLRQLCLDPGLIIDDYSGGSGKLKIAMKLVEEGINEGKKILLFSQFTSVLKNITKLLETSRIEYLYLDGATTAKDRVRLVNEFNESSSIKVFLISLKAGGTGLNLTSANLVIHFDPWWNPAIEDQATDRAHRIGQKNIVDVIKLVSEGTIEEKIITLQEDKKELINNVMNGELQNGHLLSTLSEEEIMDLFS